MGEEKRRRNILIAYCALGVIFGGIFVAIEWTKEESDLAGLMHNIGLSVVCSLIASFIFLYIQRGVETDESYKLKQQLSDIHDELKRQSKLYGSGVKDIRRKVYYDSETGFWMNILKNTDNRLDLIGHSISNWFHEDYRVLFCNKIKTMIDTGKTVCIILSCHKNQFNSENIRAVLISEKNKNNLSKVERTCLYFAELLRNVEQDKRENLEVYITDINKITYMYIRTDCQCIISPYLAAETGNRGVSFLAEFDVTSEFSGYFAKDFNDLISDGQIHCIDWNEEIFNEDTEKSQVK